MASSLGEIQTAVDLRNVVTSIAKTTVEKLRPAERIGKVYSIDLERSVAKIWFSGESIDSLIEARFAADKIPTEVMITNFEQDGFNATGNIVRIAGGPGGYYILDYVSGIPAIDPSARALVYDNTVTINQNVDEVTTATGSNTAALTELNTITLPALQDDLTVLNTTTIPALETALGQAEADIDALQNVTIPALNVRLTEAETDVNDLQTVTIPNLNTALSTAQGQIDTLNNTTIPNIQSDLSANTSAINTLTGKFPIVSTDITDGAITTPKMTANSINGDRITANTLHADKIIAASITGDRIAANAIAAVHMVIGDLTNYVADGDLQDTTFASWDSNGLTRIAASGTNPAYIEWQTNPSGNAHRYNRYYFAVAPGDEFYVEAEVSTPATNTQTVNGALAIQTYDATGTTVTWPQVYFTIPPNTGWTKYSGTFTVPAGNSVRARFDPFANANNNAGQVIRMRSMILRKKSKGTLIVDGSIVTAHMTSGTINGDVISGNTLNAAKIVSGSITTTQFTSNTINGSVISTNTLHAGRIITGSITTEQFTSNTINGSIITGSTIHGSKITANTINGDRVVANTINGDRIIANTINGDRIIGNTIVASHLSATAIDGKTITGATIQTASSGKRTVLSATATGEIEFFSGAAGVYTPAQIDTVTTVNGSTTTSFLQLYPERFSSSNATAHLSISNGNSGSVGQSKVTLLSYDFLNVTGYGKAEIYGGNELLLRSAASGGAVRITAPYLDLGTTALYLRGTESADPVTIVSLSTGQFSIYNPITNRKWHQNGAGWFSTEGSDTIGCEIYGNHVAWSDIKDKSNLKAFGKAADPIRKKQGEPGLSAIDTVRRLPVYDYDTKHGGAGKGPNGKNVLVRRRGIVAQDLKEVAPHLIDDQTNDPNTGFGMGVNMYGVIATAIGAIRELIEEVDFLKEELAKR